MVVVVSFIGHPSRKAPEHALHRVRVLPKVAQVESVLRAQTRGVHGIRRVRTSEVRSSAVILSAQTPPIEYGATAQLHANAAFQDDVPSPLEILIVGLACIVVGVE